MQTSHFDLAAETGIPVCRASEREVLGALIEDAGIFSAAMEVGLAENCFFYDDHRRIFRAIIALTDASQPVDYITVADKLGNKDSDVALIGDLITGCVLVADHILYHIELLKRTAYLRNFLDFSQWMQTAACAHGADPDDLERQARINLDRLRGQL